MLLASGHRTTCFGRNMFLFVCCLFIYAVTCLFVFCLSIYLFSYFVFVDVFLPKTYDFHAFTSKTCLFYLFGPKCFSTFSHIRVFFNGAMSKTCFFSWRASPAKRRAGLATERKSVYARPNIQVIISFCRKMVIFSPCKYHRSDNILVFALVSSTAGARIFNILHCV